MRMLKQVALAVALPLLLASPAAAQGVQTGELTGTVSSSDGLTLPGATVTVRGAALQGERTVVSDSNGVFIVRALPPGPYEVTFEMSGLATRTERVMVELGRQTTLNTVMAVAGVEEAVTVTAEVATAGLTSPTVGANYTAGEIGTLPTGRTPALIAELAPGLTNNTPNASQVTVSGGFAYDNVFMINGVDINDNIFGTANNVFIEDAIEQTSVLTSGISAEYGRFTGGVVNMITRSGGNDFSGSFRANFTNDAWTRETPREVTLGIDRPEKLNQNYEATFGGPLVRDRAWFFAAGRWQETENQITLQETNLPFTTTNENRRFEIKGTGTLAPNQTVMGNYIRNSTEVTRLPFNFTIDPNIPENPSFPNDLFVASYNGVFGARTLVNLQVSQKQFGFRGSGGTDTNVVNSPILTLGVAPNVPPVLHYNGNYFDATDPENRDNRQFAGSVAHFLSTDRWGSHDLKTGVEHFTSTLTGGNSQSATGLVFWADYFTNTDGSPALDASGRLIPIFTPGVTEVENWLATRGATLDVRTLSLYAQDNWTVNRNLTLNLGVRYENARSEATGGIIGVDTQTLMPRLAATYDLMGDGRTILQTSYAHYSGKYNETQVGRNATVGNPALLLYGYVGPEGQGRDFAPGFDLANYEVIFGEFPTANIFLEEGLSSPTAREFTASVGRQIGRGLAKVTYTNRSYSNFIEDFIDDPTASGRTVVTHEGQNFGTYDNVVYRNSNLPERNYQALLFQANYRPFNRLSVEGHWTLQLRNHGNFEGEAANQPGIGSPLGNYPEILTERSYPTGRLDDFQRHKVRLWAIWNQGLGRFGSVDLAPVFRIDSGTTYSLFANNVPLSDVQLARNPGYARLPDGGTQTLFFGERGSENFEGYALMDLGATYRIPVFRTLAPWVKVEVLNLTNNQKLIRWNSAVRPDPDSPLDANGLPTGYIRGAQFGQATANTHYPVWRPGFTGGRTFLMAAGLRF